MAVGMVSYMIVWMRRHARGLKGDIESHLASALAKGSIKALVVMAFLAVFREGLETVIFLLAVFQQSDNTAAAGGGALLGLTAAVVVGYALYRGGLRINLAKFFRATGVVLVLVSLFFAHQLTFAIDPVFIGALLLTALAVWQITGDGEAAAFEGWALIGMYGILAALTLYE